MKKVIKWILIIFGILFILGLIFGGQSNEDFRINSPKPEEDQYREVEVTDVETVDFIDEFDKNQLAAEEKYENKWVRMTGYIGNISEDIAGSYYITLNPTNEEYYFGTAVQCYFKDKSKLTQVENGQEVTVRGVVDTQVMNVLVKECVIE